MKNLRNRHVALRQYTASTPPVPRLGRIKSISFSLLSPNAHALFLHFFSPLALPLFMFARIPSLLVRG